MLAILVRPVALGLLRPPLLLSLSLSLSLALSSPRPSLFPSRVSLSPSTPPSQIEHTKGRWPLWLSPRQCAIVPISAEAHGAYAREVRDALDDAGLFCEVLDGDVSMQKRVREAQLLQYNKILVVGDAEVAAGTVNTRERDGTVTGEQRVADVALGCAEAIAAFE